MKIYYYKQINYFLFLQVVQNNWVLDEEYFCCIFEVKRFGTGHAFKALSLAGYIKSTTTAYAVVYNLIFCKLIFSLWLNNTTETVLTFWQISPWKSSHFAYYSTFWWASNAGVLSVFDIGGVRQVNF